MTALNSGQGRRLPLPLFLVALLLIALNLRVGIVVIGPLANGMGEDLALSGGALGLLTTLPLLCFGALSIFSPRFAERWGLETVLLTALWLLFLGLVLRLFGSYFWLLAGTALLGAAIAVMNVLIPSLVRGRFPHKVAALTALYSVTMTLGAASAAGMAVPVRDAFGGDWRYPLAGCALVALAGAIGWCFMLPYRTPAASGKAPSLGLWRNPRAWVFSVFFGLQSLLYYSLTAWLATVFVDAGMSEARAGELLTLFNLSGMPANFCAPLFFARMRNRRLAMVLLHVPLLISVPALMIAPTSQPVLWVVLLGLGQGSMISTGLTLIALRGADARAAAGLSGLCQSVGYLLAALGPVTLGLLHDTAGNWRIPLMLLSALLLVQFVAAVLSADGEPIG